MKILYQPFAEDKVEYPSNFHVVLKLNGFWPTDGDASNSKFRLLDYLYKIVNTVAFVSLFFLALAELSYLAVYTTDVTTAAESLAASMVAAMIFIRMFHMRYAVNQLKKVLRIFAKKIWIQKKSHPFIYKRSVRKMWPSFCFGISIWSTFWMYNVQPIIGFLTSEQLLTDENKPFPYLMYFPYDEQKPLNYILTYIACVYGGLVCVSQYYAMDAIFSLFVSFACGQFEVLHGRILLLIPECHEEWLRHFGMDVKMESAENQLMLQKIYIKRLHQLIEHHKNIIKFCQELERLFSFPLMVNLATSTLLIGLGGFQFITNGNSVLDLLRFFLYLLSVAGQLYVLCDLGSTLINQSKATASVLFICNWEGGRISRNSPLLFQQNAMDLKFLNHNFPSWKFVSYYPTCKEFRQKLNFMILRSHRPIQLTAMKYSILSMETFSSILSLSLSYFALLKSLYQEH